MGMRDCKSKSEIEKEKCPLARELLRGVAICADPKLASRQFAAAKKRPPIGVTSFQRIFGVNPAAGEPTISMTALLELLFA